MDLAPPKPAHLSGSPRTAPFRAGTQLAVTVLTSKKAPFQRPTAASER